MSRLIIFLFTVYTLLFTIFVRPTLANGPDNHYLKNDYFELFGYIANNRDTNDGETIGMFKVYENRERKRTYSDIAICGTNLLKLGFQGRLAGDHRVKNCYEDSDCVGEVDMCERKGFGTGAQVGTISSPQGTCHTTDAHPGPYRCSYRARPKISSDLVATDFSYPNNSCYETTNSLTSPTEATTSPLIYPKYQNAASRFDNIGSDNTITWGSTNLGTNNEFQILRRLKTLFKAWQTQTIVTQTGDWPLGWVDWEYMVPGANCQTLLTIYNSIGDSSIKSNLAKLVEAEDEFYLSNGKTMPQVDSLSQQIYDRYLAARSSTWAQAVAVSPLYPPSIRKGYARASICVWGFCFPNPELETFLPDSGIANTLYSDLTIHAAFVATLEDLFLRFPLPQAIKFYQQESKFNPLIRFVTVASIEATPDKIYERLDAENTPMYGPSPFKLKKIGHIYDYQRLMDANGYYLQPELEKQTAAAIPPAGLLNIILYKIELLYYRIIDIVDDLTFHLITIPDAMGHSITEMQNFVYDAHDTLSTLAVDQPINAGLSNVVDDGGDYLYGGETSFVFSAQRRLAYHSCSSKEYSSPHLTSIEDYVHGARNGCTPAASEATCDGKDFAKLIEASSYSYNSLTDNAKSAYQGMEASLTPELLKVYAQASEETGVPCEVLAGIHFVEADLNPNGSLVSGREIGTPEPDAGGKVFGSLLETAVYAGEHLKSKVGGSITSPPSLITALSRYNGGGNSNCQQGYPYSIPYGGCPRAFEGEDDPYPVNWLDSRHSSMYLLYCADYTACEPQVWQRPGAFTFAIAMYENLTKDGAMSEEIANTPVVENPTTPLSGTPATPFTPITCGPESLATALGCLPVSQDLTTTIVSFAIGIAGGISLLVMLLGTIQLMTAGADPEKQKRGKELFTGAIVGLLFIIFSAVLLQTIAGDIIKLPGF